ncbi:MAG: homoserine dehydrogenase [Bacteroidetes bacterium]|nr:MAG: homoserine dehydrogenase [Bacteroidota bacterium]
MTKNKKQNIALIGLGCVGSGFYALQEKNDAIDVKYIVVKDKTKKRNAPAELIRFEYDSVLADADIEVIVELIDDAEVALDIARKALNAGKDVVSANKKMIANHLPELLDLAKQKGRIFRFEAAVCGSIPILQTLNNYLNGLAIESVSGILNGSSNYILSKMHKESLSFDSALQLAQTLGFAETDPTLDIGGFDAASKLRILSAFAFGRALKAEEVIQAGITGVEYRDLHYARQRQLRLKSLAFANPTGLAYVLPAFVKAEHASYGVEQEYNIAVVESDELGTQSFVGKGAGSIPTGKAVLEDVIAVARGEAYQIQLKEEPNDLKGEIEIYFRFPSALPPEIEFVEQKEVFRSTLVNYVVGIVSTASLRKASEYLQKPGYFLAVFPESLQVDEPEISVESRVLSL